MNVCVYKMDLLNQNVIMALVDSSGLDEMREILLNSSSDSDSNDEEDGPPTKKEKREPTFYDHIERYNDIDFKQTFHMSRSTYEVCELIKLFI